MLNKIKKLLDICEFGFSISVPSKDVFIGWLIGGLQMTYTTL